MGRVTTIITGDASKLTEEQRKVAEAAKSMRNEFAEVDRTIQRMGREADRVFRDTRTAQENYNKQLDNLSTLLRHNKIDQDTYNRAVRQAKEAFDDAGDAGKRTFGDAFNARVASNITALGGMLSITQLIRETFSGAREEADRIGDTLDLRFLTRGQIAQVAGTEAEFREMSALSESLLARGAATSIVESDKIVLALKAANQLSEADVFGDIARVGLVDELEGLVKAVNFMKQNFGEAESGGARAMLSKAFAAGGPSTFESIELLKEAAQVSGGAQKAGLSDEELLAALTVLAESATSPELAKTLLRNVFAAGAKKDIKSTGLADLIGQFQGQMQADRQTSAQYFGDIRTIEGFDLLVRDFAQVAQLTKDIMAANSGDMLDQKIRLMEREESTAIGKRVAIGRMDVSKIQTGIGAFEQQQDAIDSATEEMLIQGGVGPFMRSLGRTGRGWQRYFGISPGPSAATTMDYMSQGQIQGNQALIDAVQRVVDLQGQATQLLQRQDDREERRGQDPQRRPQPTSPRVPRPETN
jgi:hypothetical protein